MTEDLEERIREAGNREEKDDGEENRPDRLELYRLEEAKNCLDWIVPAVFSGGKRTDPEGLPGGCSPFLRRKIIQCEKEAERTADVLARDTLNTGTVQGIMRRSMPDS